MRNKKLKFYDPTRILSKGCQYNIVIGQRSNGKTYAILKLGLDNFIKSGEQMAIIRRWKEDVRGKRAGTMFDNLVANGYVNKATKGVWSTIVYKLGAWYLANYDEDLQKYVTHNTPLAYSFALSDVEHDKSTSYPNITLVLFDEFLTRTTYLNDEFVLFMNTISTIKRHRTNVTIFMCGNTVNKFSPYFKEMGLKHIQQMKVGDIDVYTYGSSSLKVAVEYSDGIGDTKKSDDYFAFDNPRLNMITDGSWEIDIYPHCPIKYLESDIIYKYFIEFDDNLLQCEVVSKGNEWFTFIHEKTTPIRHPESDLLFTTKESSSINIRHKLSHPTLPLERKLYEFFVTGKVFYQDNEIGEIVRNYFVWCG